MTDDNLTWAERAAARLTADRPSPGGSTPVASSEVPAWAQVLADRAAGRQPDPEVLRDAREGAQRPRKDWENQLLARLGYDVQGDAPPAA